MLRKIIALTAAVIFALMPSFGVFADEYASNEMPKAVTEGIYFEGDLVFDRTTGVEHIKGYDYIYSNPPSSDKISITVQNTDEFRVSRYYYSGGLHDCFLNTLMYIGGGFGDNTRPKEIPGNIAQVRIADSVKNGAGEKFDLLLQIKNLVITPDPQYCSRDPLEGVCLFYYQEAQDPIISTTPSAYDDFGTATEGPAVYGRYKVEYEYEFKVVMSGTDENAPQGTLLYGSRDFDCDLEGYDIVSGVRSGTDREDPTIYVEPDTITSISYIPNIKCYRICGTIIDENTWRSGFAALFDSTGSTLRWFGFKRLGTTIIGQEAFEFTRYYNVTGEIIRGEGTIDPVDVTVQAGMNVNCVIDPADDHYISVIRLYEVDDQTRETLIGTLDSEEVKRSDPYYVPLNNIDSNYRYEVEFEKKYRIDLTVINGRVGDSGDIAEASYYVIPGGSKNLIYSGDEGYELKTVEVDGETVDEEEHSNNYLFENVQADHRVTVTYERKYTVETSVINGSISESLTVWRGESAFIKYMPNEGYHLSSVTVDGSAQDVSLYPDTYSFENVDADHMIEVVYEPNSTLISKVDEAGNFLIGAELMIIDSEGNILDEWITENDDHVLFALGEGNYRLVEKAAPPGYIVSDDIEFTIDSGGTITVNGQVTDKVIMVDTKIQRLPNTGGNGAGMHFVLMGILVMMLSSTVMITKRN